MDVTQSRREVRVMPVATEEAVTQCGSLPSYIAGKGPIMLPMQQVSDREMEGGTCRTVTAGGSLSQSPVRRTESGLLGDLRIVPRCSPTEGACVHPARVVFTADLAVNQPRSGYVERIVGLAPTLLTWIRDQASCGDSKGYPPTKSFTFRYPTVYNPST